MLAGCAQPSPSGTKTVLVPVESELILKAKTSATRQSLLDEAQAFIDRELQSGAERIEVLALGKEARWVSEKLKKHFALQQRQLDYRHDDAIVPKSNQAQLRLIVHRTELFIPECPPFSLADMWSLPQGCYVERSRNRSLHRPSSLLPVAVELSEER